MVMIARLKNNEVLETKTVDTEIVRASDALDGFGWYNVTQDSVVHKVYERVTNTTYTLIGDLVHEQYTVEQLSLDDWKAIKKAEIKLGYLNSMQEGFTSTSGVTVDCRESDKINWLGVKIESTNLGLTNVSIRDFSNVQQILTKEAFDTLYYELYGYYDSQLTLKWTKQTQIDNATTHDEVAAIEW